MLRRAVLDSKERQVAVLSARAYTCALNCAAFNSLARTGQSALASEATQQMLRKQSSAFHSRSLHAQLQWLTCSWCAAAWARHPAESQAPLSDAEAFALAEDASLDLGGVALGDDAWSLASGKNVSLYCNGKEVTPEEHATQLGGNKTKVLSCECMEMWATC